MLSCQPSVLPLNPCFRLSHGLRPGSSAGDASYDAARAKLGERRRAKPCERFYVSLYVCYALLTLTNDFSRQRRRIPSSLHFSSHSIDVVIFGCSSAQQQQLPPAVGTPLTQPTSRLISTSLYLLTPHLCTRPLQCTRLERRAHQPELCAPLTAGDSLSPSQLTSREAGSGCAADATACTLPA